MVFRYPKPEDFEVVWHYACDLAAEDTFVELSGPPPTREEETKYFTEMLTRVEKGEEIRLTVFVNDQYAGSGEVRRGKYRHNHVGEIGLSLAAKYRDERIGTELMKALIDEARAQRLRLLTISCFVNNPRALHVYEKLGFKQAGVIPGAIAYKGEYVGEVKLYLPLNSKAPNSNIQAPNNFKAPNEGK